MLKFMLVALALSSAAPALAADVCDTLVQCGTYSVSGQDDAGTTSSVTIVIASAGPSQATLSFTRQTGDHKSVFPIDLTFNPDNSYVGKIATKTYATGICRDRKICTFALTPMTNDANETYGIAGVIVFRGATLEYVKLGAGPGDSITSTTVLTKQ